AAKVEDPRGLKLDWPKLAPKELARLLDDPRPAVQRRAIRDLAKHDGAKVAAALKPLLRALEAGGELSDEKAIDPTEPFHRRSASETARMNAVWTLTRIDAPEARQLVRGALLDSHHDVRQVALQSVSLWRDRAALPQVLKLLRLCTVQNMRLSAEILGRLGDKSVVAQLLEAARTSIATDRFREHAITFALIEIADPQGTAVGLKSRNRHERQVAMIALDQMPGGGLTPDQVVPLLTEQDPALRETALWLVARHGEWGDALANHLREELKRDRLREHEQRDLTRLLAQFAGTLSVQQLMAGHVKAGAASDSESTVRLMVLHAMQSSGLKQMPESWLASLTNMLAGQDETLKPSAVAVVRALPLPKTGTEELAKALRLVALHNGTLPEARIEAVAALPAGAGNLEPELFSLLIGGLSEETSVSARSAAVEALLKTKLTVEQQTALADAIPRVGPLELNRLLGAFETSTEEAVGLKLVAGLKQSPVLTSLRVDSVTLRLAKFPASVQQQAEALYAAINVEAARQKERLDEVVGLVGQGDIRRGQLVFANSKAACVACHAIGYKGGN
ncbi:MAG: dehydrogenase, partial [Candidatus Saccharimonas sp.]|nr:dehydrogenase [Planctomycetaceae bacterium]